MEVSTAIPPKYLKLAEFLRDPELYLGNQFSRKWLSVRENLAEIGCISWQKITVNKCSIKLHLTGLNSVEHCLEFSELQPVFCWIESDRFDDCSTKLVWNKPLYHLDIRTSKKLPHYLTYLYKLSCKNCRLNLLRANQEIQWWMLIRNFVTYFWKFSQDILQIHSILCQVHNNSFQILKFNFLFSRPSILYRRRHYFGPLIFNFVTIQTFANQIWRLLRLNQSGCRQ